MKFSASFSGGKDSTLAIKRMLDQGNDLVALIVSTKKEQDLSWTHNLEYRYFEDVGQILACKVIFTR
ncbi:MAG: selenocysteine lyase, partial [Peptostreptococcus sp.]|nr:selenocysteine lyase [Peptostreptococcus sp.]